MTVEEDVLARLVSFLLGSAAVLQKVKIRTAYERAQTLAGEVALGDDCAAIKDGDGWLLLAAEGMLASFVAQDPWFAGYSAVMVNLSDVAAMGGRALAIVDVLWTPGLNESAAIWDGMSAASRAYEVPIVGGHTTVTTDGPIFLAAAVLGRSKRLLTSFDAKPGDDLLAAIDLRGSWRGDNPFWNASVNAPPGRLRADLDLFPDIAETGWCSAAKDISNGGIVGTLAMLLDCSRVGAELWLDRIPRPPGTNLERWLTAFPSFGYLLSIPPENRPGVIERFESRGIACAPVGGFTFERSLMLCYGQSRTPFPLWQEESAHRATFP